MPRPIPAATSDHVRSMITAAGLMVDQKLCLVEGRELGHAGIVGMFWNAPTTVKPQPQPSDHLSTHQSNAILT
jgi:hypothetical protein